MKNIDYKGRYKLKETNAGISEVSLEKAVAQTMNRSVNIQDYCIRKKDSSDLVIFGRGDPIQMDSNDALLILTNQWGSDLPAVVLRYKAYPNQIAVGYVQTPHDVSFEDYKTIKSGLEMRPHDLIFAHFLARLAPVLDKFPDTDVFFSPFYLDRPVYPFLRDRFLDRDYFLNPQKVRVQQILGGKNSWLEESSVQERSHARDDIKINFLTRLKFWDLLV